MTVRHSAAIQRSAYTYDSQLLFEKTDLQRGFGGNREARNGVSM